MRTPAVRCHGVFWCALAMAYIQRCKLMWVCLKMSCTPFYPMVLLIIIPIFYGYNWEYTLFSDKPMFLWFLGISNPTDVASCFGMSKGWVFVFQFAPLIVVHMPQTREVLKASAFMRHPSWRNLQANIGKQFGNREFLFCFPNLFVLFSFQGTCFIPA